MFFQLLVVLFAVVIFPLDSYAVRESTGNDFVSLTASETSAGNIQISYTVLDSTDVTGITVQRTTDALGGVSVPSISGFGFLFLLFLFTAVFYRFAVRKTRETVSALLILGIVFPFGVAVAGVNWSDLQTVISIQNGSYTDANLSPNTYSYRIKVTTSTDTFYTDSVTVTVSGSASGTSTIGGVVSNLRGTVVLQNNGGDDLTIDSEGSFNFPKTLTSGEAYNVGVVTHPTGQTCTVSNGTGTVSGSNVVNISIVCSTSCSNNTSPQFSAFVTDMSKVRVVIPLGSANGDEIKNRVYLHTGPSDSVPVYAPADGIIDAGAFYQETSSSQSEYWFEMVVSCEVRATLDHITDPVDKIKAVFPLSPASSSVSQELTGNVVVSAGELLGQTTGTQAAGSWDFVVTNTTHVNNFVNQQRYETAPNLGTKIISDCPFDYYSASMQNTYFALFGSQNGTLVASTDCRSVSRDKAGTIAGAWFLDSGTDETYKSQIAIAMELDGEVRLALSSVNLVLGTANSTHADPESVTGEHCYSDGGNYAYFRNLSTTQMDLAIGSGTCPSSFPSSGFKTYSR